MTTIKLTEAAQKRTIQSKYDSTALGMRFRRPYQTAKIDCGSAGENWLGAELINKLYSFGKAAKSDTAHLIPFSWDNLSCGRNYAIGKNGEFAIITKLAERYTYQTTNEKKEETLVIDKSFAQVRRKTFIWTVSYTAPKTDQVVFEEGNLEPCKTGKALKVYKNLGLLDRHTGGGKVKKVIFERLASGYRIAFLMRNGDLIDRIPHYSF